MDSWRSGAPCSCKLSLRKAHRRPMHNASGGTRSLPWAPICFSLLLVARNSLALPETCLSSSRALRVPEHSITTKLLPAATVDRKCCCQAMAEGVLSNLQSDQALTYHQALPAPLLESAARGSRQKPTLQERRSRQCRVVSGGVEGEGRPGRRRLCCCRVCSPLVRTWVLADVRLQNAIPPTI